MPNRMAAACALVAVALSAASAHAAKVDCTVVGTHEKTVAVEIATPPAGLVEPRTPSGSG